MKKSTQQVLNAIQCRQPIEARAIQRLTKLDISDVHRNLRTLNREGKVKKTNKRKGAASWEVV